MTVAEMLDLLKMVRCKEFNYDIGLDGSRPFLQVSFSTTDARTGYEEITFKGRKWMLSEHMTRSEFVQTCFLATQIAQEHETRENFRYRGNPIFGPHFHIDDLYGICDKRDVRPDRR